MTKEQSQTNIENYLKLIDSFWEFDDESRAFIERRLKADWEFPEEYKSLFSLGTYDGDQRVFWDFNTTEVEDGSEDEGFRLFNTIYKKALDILRKEYNIIISFAQFSDNKIIFNKNQTKIKKVLQEIYTQNEEARRDDLRITSVEEIERAILLGFERIGVYKKPNRKLKIVVSLNPVDWILCSTAGSISSCLNLDKVGGDGFKYFGGLPFLCGDPNRALIYITDGEKKEYRGIKVDSHISRSWILLNTTKRFQIVKWYANCFCNVNKIIDITKVPNFYMSDSFSKGLYDIIPLFLKNGLFLTIFNDIGKYVKQDKNTYKIVGEYGKGGFQLFHKTGFDIKENLFRYDLSKFREKVHFSLNNFEKVGATFNNIAHTTKCPSCHEEKIFLLINENNSPSETICFDCASERTYVCSYCGNLKFDKPELVNFVNSSGVIESRKICKSCCKILIRCSHCGLAIDSNSAIRVDNGTHQKEFVCTICLNDVKNNYHKCENCNAVSQNSVLCFNYLTSKFEWYCKDHIVDYTNEEMFDTRLIKYDGEIYRTCPRCGNFTLNSKNQCIFCDNIGKWNKI